jgi:hypothetical protein
MASKLKLTELLYPTSTTAAITINSDDSVTIPTQSTTNLAYTGTLTGGTGVVNLGSGQFYKDASGNVGIGTSSPGAKLDVTNNQAALSYLIDTNNTTNGGSSIWRMITRNIANTGTTSVEFYKPTGSGFGLLNNDTNASNFTSFNVGASERMRILSDGAIAIGQTTGNGVGTLTLNKGIYVPSTNNPTVQLVSNISTVQNSAIVNNWANGANTGILIGTSETGGYALQVSSSIPITSGLPTGAGTVRMVVQGNGDVGIGTASPNQKLQVVGSNGTGFAGATLQNSNANVGLAGVQFSSDTTYSKSAIAQVRENANGAGPLVFYVDSATDAADWSAGDEKMRISAAGNLLVGNTDTAYNNQNGVQLLGSSIGAIIIGHANGVGSGNGYLNFNYNASAIGSVTQNGTTAVLYNTSSDYRLKEITGAVTAKEAKDFIMALQPKQGTWKADGSKFVGFLAHEFQAVSPTSVNGDKDAVDEDGKPIYQGMQAASSEVMANLIALVQEQQALITQLQADVATLKGAA